MDRVAYKAQKQQLESLTTAHEITCTGKSPYTCRPHSDLDADPSICCPLEPEMIRSGSADCRDISDDRCIPRYVPDIQTDYHKEENDPVTTDFVWNSRQLSSWPDGLNQPNVDGDADSEPNYSFSKMPSSFDFRRSSRDFELRAHELNVDDQPSYQKYQSEASSLVDNEITQTCGNGSKVYSETTLKPLPVDIVSCAGLDSLDLLQPLEKRSLDEPKLVPEDDGQDDIRILRIRNGHDLDGLDFSSLFLQKWLCSMGNQRFTSVFGTLKNILIERGMEEFRRIPGMEWMAHSDDNEGSPGSETGPASSSSPNSASSSNSESSNTRHKRLREEGDGAPDESQGPPEPPTPSLENSLDRAYRPRLACHFRKHDPERYRLDAYRVCATSSWDTTARVREHLFRVHLCKHQEEQDAEGVTPAMEAKIKSIKRIYRPQSLQSQSDRWKEIYEVLFPNEPVPSPYFHPVPDNAIRRSDNPQNLTLQEYAERQLPRRVRALLGHNVQDRLQSLEEALKSDVASIVSDCQAQLSREFYSRQENEGELCLPAAKKQLGVGNQELSGGASVPARDRLQCGEDFKGKAKEDMMMHNGVLQQPRDVSEAPIVSNKNRELYILECCCGGCRCPFVGVVDFSGRSGGGKDKTEQST